MLRLLLSKNKDEFRQDSDKKMISKSWIGMHAWSRFTFAKLCEEVLFKFQWQIEKLLLEFLFLGPW